MIEARWTQSPDYYRQFWTDWLGARSQFRKRAAPVGIALVLCGAAVLSVPDSGTGRSLTSGLIVGAMGLAVLVWHQWDRVQWLRTMTSAAHAGEVRLQFDHDRILHRGPTSHGEMSWNAVEQLTKGAHGLFLVLQRGLSVYVPLAAFHVAEDVAAVERMFVASRATSHGRGGEPPDQPTTTTVRPPHGSRETS